MPEPSSISVDWPGCRMTDTRVGRRTLPLVRQIGLALAEDALGYLARWRRIIWISQREVASLSTGMPRGQSQLGESGDYEPASSRSACSGVRSAGVVQPRVFFANLTCARYQICVGRPETQIKVGLAPRPTSHTARASLLARVVGLGRCSTSTRSRWLDDRGAPRSPTR